MADRDALQVVRKLNSEEHLKNFDVFKRIALIESIKWYEILSEVLAQLEREWEEEVYSCIFNTDHLYTARQCCDNGLHAHPCAHPDNRQPGVWGNCRPRYCPLKEEE